MYLFGKNLSQDTVIIAEIGVNHEGNLAKALELIELAKEAGADAVKFQSYTPERYASASDPERLARVTRFCLDLDAHKKLAEHAATLGIAFFSTPLTEDWVEKLDPLVPAFKIASGDLTFEPVIRAAARTRKPVLLSTGLGTIDEIDRAVSWVQSEIGAAPIAQHLSLLHCVASYPVPIDQANTRAIAFLKRRYGLPIGYSNHTIGLESCYAAAAQGAQIIEVHFTDQKSGRSFRDHELSFEFEDLRQLIRTAPALRSSLGLYGKNRMPSEEPNLKALRKGVVAARNLEEGHILTAKDLMYARPALYFAASDLPSLIGKTLISTIGKGEMIKPEHLKS